MKYLTCVYIIDKRCEVPITLLQSGANQEISLDNNFNEKPIFAHSAFP